MSKFDESSGSFWHTSNFFAYVVSSTYFFTVDHSIAAKQVLSEIASPFYDEKIILIVAQAYVLNAYVDN